MGCDSGQLCGCGSCQLTEGQSHESKELSKADEEQSDLILSEEAKRREGTFGVCQNHLGAFSN